MSIQPIPRTRRAHRGLWQTDNQPIAQVASFFGGDTYPNPFGAIENADLRSPSGFALGKPRYFRTLRAMKMDRPEKPGTQTYGELYPGRQPGQTGR